MLDLMGNISLSLQVAILFLLILGLPLSHGVSGKRNLMRHGYLTVVALVLHAILIFWDMIPTLVNGLPAINSLPILSAVNVWSHIILGTFAEVLGGIIVAFWFSKPLNILYCARLKKWMLPLFIIWMISLINGSLIHILQIL